MLDSGQSLVFYMDYSGIHFVYGVCKVWDPDSHRIHGLLRALGKNTLWNMGDLHPISAFAVSPRLFEGEKAAASLAKSRQSVCQSDSRFPCIVGLAFLGTGTYARERGK
jgi:hypothetical protein